MREHGLNPGRFEVRHPWKGTSIFAGAFEHGIPLTVHPGIGYDIISNHPWFNAAAIGRASGVDFRVFGGAVENTKINRSEEHTSELQSHSDLVCRLLLEKKKKKVNRKP